ncbi:putative Mannosyl-oligosaccharide 1,2-alpha-mannosidase MNS1 [Blattamonas nauphoetae]|uniref:alpha-1,2-Mannosidase n=1 Tax=Blattamonas nauphoetae TaxID=2049346 RepID=A0ABQ9XTD3_9EUKA|nr:putative Mannosyl-oligosaccharide 1,2-alpha-mannosidase MNS1 [Blattamonas nauphoetae]
MLVHFVLLASSFFITPFEARFMQNSKSKASSKQSNQMMFPLTRKTPKHQTKPGVPPTHEVDPTEPLKPLPQPPSPLSDDPVFPTPHPVRRYVDILDSPPASRWPKLQNEALCKQRRDEIKEAFLYAWEPYELYAWGHDEINPISRTPYNWLSKQATMIIDSATTMKIMGLEDKFKKCMDWIKNDMKVYKGGSSNLFETTIRILGGLISLYDLSGDKQVLDRAEELGDAIIYSFDSNTITSIPRNSFSFSKPSRKPTFETRLETLMNDPSHNASKLYLPTQQDLEKGTGTNSATSCLAELGVYFELVALSDRTGDPHYAKHALRALQVSLAAPRSAPGVVRAYIQHDGSRTTGPFTIGSFADSFYEYLIKTGLYSDEYEIDLVGHTANTSKPLSEPKSINDHWEEIMKAFYKNVRTNGDGFKFIPSDGSGGTWEHLACFAGGNLGLGAYYLNNWTKLPSQQVIEHPVNEKMPKRQDKTPTTRADWLDTFFQLGKDLTHTCYQMYHGSPSGLSGVEVNMNVLPTGSKPIREYDLCPEAVESIFYMWRLTGDPIWQEYNWEIFQSIKRHARLDERTEGTTVVPGGYSCISDPSSATPHSRDKMTTFFLSETLKYIYLTFCDPDTVMPLDKWVFSTEAHPFAQRKYLKVIKP